MVNKAEEHFKRDVSLAGFMQPSAHTSSVHGFNFGLDRHSGRRPDSKTQAYIVAIASRNQEEIYNNAYLAFAAHLIDDYFDRPDLPPTPQQMKQNRGNIYPLIHSVTGLGQFVDIASSKTNNQTGFDKGIKRLMYGGLIQLAESEREQIVYLSEYKSLSLSHVDRRLHADILNLRDISYWMTTKTIQEFFLLMTPVTT